MRFLNLTGPSRSIGHTAANKALHLPDEKVIELLDRAKVDGYDGIRWNWAWDSMFPSPHTPNIDRLLFVVAACVNRGLFCWPVHGGGPYPNQTGWVHKLQASVGTAGTATWHGALPPMALHEAILERINWALEEVWWELANNGYDPQDSFALQCGNEHADGGNGDPTRTDYTTVKNGTGLLNAGMAAYLEFLALGINTRGMRLIAPGMECQAKSAMAEIADLCRHSWMRRFEVIDVHCYDDTPCTHADKLNSLVATIGMHDNAANRPIWIGETDCTDLDGLMDATGVQAAGYYSQD